MLTGKYRLIMSV